MSLHRSKSITNSFAASACCLAKNSQQIRGAGSFDIHNKSVGALCVLANTDTFIIHWTTTRVSSMANAFLNYFSFCGRCSPIIWYMFNSYEFTRASDALTFLFHTPNHIGVYSSLPEAFSASGLSSATFSEGTQSRALSLSDRMGCEKW